MNQISRRLARALPLRLAAVLLLALGLAQAAYGARTQRPAAALYPYQDPALPASQRAADLLARMTLDEKIGQMTQAERSVVTTVDDMATYGIGSLLSGGGSAPSPNTPAAWADMIDRFQTAALRSRLGIPMLYGIDAVHGHNNVVGAVIFPHNIGLGASRNATLARQIGAATAEEVYATGIRWTFSPCLCVARDERWGRTYESFGEDPQLATQLATIIDGYQGTRLSDRNSILATAKHYIADGGTRWGSSPTGMNEGDTVLSEADLRRIHLPPYVEAIRRNVGSIMPSFSSWNGTKLHAHRYLLTDLLKNELGFSGFVISDWAAIDQIPGPYNTDVRSAINAGVDMVMVPYDYKLFINTLRSEVQAGNVSIARIDDAVRRILIKKFELGLFEQPFADRTNIAAIGSQAHRDLARQAVRESLVLLKNANNLLPLSTTPGRVLVAGKSADDIGLQSGGWTISWQGSSGNITPGTTILQGIRANVAAGTQVTYIRNPDAGQVSGYNVGIVVVGETPYAEGQGDNGTLELAAEDSATVQRVCGAMPCVVVLVSGRPLIINTQLTQANAFVAAWLPGTEGAGVAEVLFGRANFTGRLPMSWPRSVSQLPLNVGDATYDPLFAYGFGLSYGSTPTATPSPTPTRTPTATPTRTPTATPTPSGSLPDLVVTGMAVTSQTGGCPATPLGLRVTVANNGGAAAGSFSVTANGASQTVTGLAAGASTSLWFAGYVSGSPNTATADSGNQVAESNENNNTLSQLLPIPTAPFCPTATPTRTPTATATPTRTPTPTATPTPGSGGSCRVSYRISSQWGNGFNADVVITNTGPAVNGWTLAWTFPGNQTIVNMWNAVSSQSGAQVQARDAGWNAAIATGGTASFGFQAGFSGSNPAPTNFTLNGSPCTVVP
ncbi:MAG: hypothetical protein OHK0022_61570 [Roseiflexaceae bacterium]